MGHPFMEAIAGNLYQRGIATLRYQFAYMERGTRRPDPPHLAHAVVRVAVKTASELLPGLTLIAGGKSFGGRMTSQAQAASPLPSVSGLAFLGFPLHPAGQPSAERARHLDDVLLPMLFLQGSRDALADLALLHPAIDRLGGRATLAVIDGADHSFRMPAGSGRNATEVRDELARLLKTWIDALAATALSTRAG
jgi:predicted alpha/beta-hydrolase family hydrolase